MPATPISSEDDAIVTAESGVLDLRDLDELVESRHARRFDEDHIVEWLRTSGGPLAERIMKTAAADLIDGIRTRS